MNAKRAAAKSGTKGDRRFMALVVVILAVGLAVIGYVVLKPKPAAVIVDSNLPLPAAQGYVIGSDSAPVEIVEFGDFECPGCADFWRITEFDVRNRLVATGAARFRFVDFPWYEIHPGTMFAHNAAACANAQNKFWEMSDRIYSYQFEWSEIATGKNKNPPKIFKRYAKELGLDTKAFNTCLDSRQFDPQIMANRQEGVRRNVGSTPTVFVGNRMLTVAPTYDRIKALVDTVTTEVRKAASASKKPGRDAAKEP